MNEPPLTQLGRALTEVDELKVTVNNLTNVLSTERATTKRFRYNMAVLSALVMINLIGTSFSFKAAHDAKLVADTLSDCLIVGGNCYEQLARNGQLGSNRVLDFNGCMFLIEPTVRVPADITKCKKEADDKFFASIEKATKEAPK
jgi:hypothetical protein